MELYNKESDKIYRSCIDESKGNCPYMFFNEYGTACCSIDKIYQVEYYGCTPAEILKYKNKKYFKDLKVDF